LNKQQLLQEAIEALELEELDLDELIEVSLSEEVTNSKRDLAQFMVALEQMRLNVANPVHELDVSGDWLENW
jgi:hypothetical protein